MPKILIIDDEPAIRELYKYVFEEAGYETLQAPNGREALDIISGGAPDFMLVDVAMPEMSGKELVVELGRIALQRPCLAQIPFVVMTGENFMDSELNRVFASAPGFICCFPKMIPPEKIVEKAESVLNGGLEARRAFRKT